MRMPFGKLSPLAGGTVTCPVCGQVYSPNADGDNTPTNLACGHSVCFKCIQLEWCKSVSTNVDTVHCPICRDQVLVCFERDSVKSDQSLEFASKMKPGPQIPSNLTPTTSEPINCSNVLASHISERTTPNETFQNIPLTNTIVDIQQLGSDMTFATPDLPVDLTDKSWPMDLMNIQTMLEKKGGEVDDLTPHIDSGTMFTDATDSDIGSVQDILKIVNMPGDSLLDDCSLNAFFSNEEHPPPPTLHLPPPLPRTRESLKNAAISVSEFSDFSEFFHNPSMSASNDWAAFSACHGRGIPGSDVPIKDPQNSFVSSYTPRGRRHKRGSGCKSRRQSGAMTRRRNAGRGYRRTILSPAARLDGLYLETCSAVAAIQEGDCPERTVTERLASVKENLHDRFYPKTNKKHQQLGKLDKKNARILMEPVNAVADLQMVKIMSNIQIAAKREEVPDDQECVDKHNYGYVTNSMLSDGNEITNLYVVPKTWLNCDDVEGQYNANGTEPEVLHPSEISTQGHPDMGMSSATEKRNVAKLPTTGSMVQYFPKNFLDKTGSPEKSQEDRQDQTSINENLRKDKDPLLTLALADGGDSNTDSSGFIDATLPQNGENCDSQTIGVQSMLDISAIAGDGGSNEKSCHTANGVQHIDNSLLSCSALFSSTESMKPEDLQEWYKPSESSEHPFDVTAFFGLDDGLPDKMGESGSLYRSSAVVSPLFRGMGPQGHAMNIIHHDSVVGEMFETKNNKCHPSSTLDKSWSASPPYMGRRRRGSKTQSVHSLSKDDECPPKFKIKGRPRKTSATNNMQNVWITSHVPQNEKSKSSTETKLAEHDENLVTDMLIQIKELDACGIVKPDIRLMSTEIYKLVRLSKRRIDNSILQMIKNQVSTVVSCAKSMDCLDDCQTYLLPDMKENLHMQKQMLRLIVSRGVAFIIELISVCELQVDIEQQTSPVVNQRNNGRTANVTDTVKQSPQSCAPRSFHLTEQMVKCSMLDESKTSDACSATTDTCSSDVSVAMTPPVVETSKEKPASSSVAAEKTTTTTVKSNITTNVDTGTMCSLSPFSEETEPSHDEDCSREKQKGSPRCDESDPDYNEGEESSCYEGDSDDQSNVQESVLRRRHPHGGKRTQNEATEDRSNHVLPVRTEASTTPKKRRTRSDTNASQLLDTPRNLRIKTPTKVTRGRKRVVKKKDIYASSSEEIIPVRIKRGFQYTEECFKVFNTVYNHKLSGEFCKEIKSSAVPSYYKVIKRAMWLDLIAHKLRLSRYEQLEDFVADMRLVFSNSHLFNRVGTDVYEAGIICEKLFEETLSEQFPDKNL